MKKPNPCNCGCADVEIKRIPYTCDEDSLYFCQCQSCGRNGPNVWGGGYPDDRNRERAITEWNKMTATEWLKSVGAGVDGKAAGRAFRDIFLALQRQEEDT